MSEEQRLELMSGLSSTINGLANYRGDLENQLVATTDPAQRAELRLQINLPDNQIRQVANLGKDTLSLLYQQTGVSNISRPIRRSKRPQTAMIWVGALQELALAAAAGTQGGAKTDVQSNVGDGAKGTGSVASGAENAALYPRLKDQLGQQNLANIAARDQR